MNEVDEITHIERKIQNQYSKQKHIDQIPSKLEKFAPQFYKNNAISHQSIVIPLVFIFGGQMSPFKTFGPHQLTK